MTIDRSTAMKALVDALEHLGMYNDKGWQWAKHTPEEIAKTRQSFQADLEQHAMAIGQDTIPAELWAAIMSGAAVHDESGKFWAMARRTLSGME